MIKTEDLQEKIEVVGKRIRNYSTALDNIIESLRVTVEEQKELEKMVDELKGAEKVWPQDGDKYYFVTVDGDIILDTWEGGSYDNDIKAVGNCYRTKEEAEFEIERRKVMTEFKKFARDFVAGDWNYCIVWDFYADELYVDYRNKLKSNNLYFESEEKAWEAIEVVGEDRVKKYILGVVDND